MLPGLQGPIQTGLSLKAPPFDTAYVFPNSWRAALPPFVARIPVRVGFRGHARACLLTTIRPTPQPPPHQQWEYAAILGLPGNNTPLPLPALALPQLPQGFPQVDPSVPLVALLPGAARGPAKRWPAVHFIEAARNLHARTPCRFVIMGTPAEEPLCRSVSDALQPDASCLAGKTSLPMFAAALQACAAVLANDSGGMHLAAAVGTPVVAIFGLTNPEQTGPIGPNTVCIQPDNVQGSRQIARTSEKAKAALASIPPQRATDALFSFLTQQRRPA